MQKILGELSRAGMQTRKFLSVVLPPGLREHVPDILLNYDCYPVDPEVEDACAPLLRYFEKYRTTPIPSRLALGAKLGHVVQVDRFQQWTKLVYLATRRPGKSQFLLFLGHRDQGLEAFRERIVRSLAEEVPDEDTEVRAVPFDSHGNRHGPTDGGQWLKQIAASLGGQGDPAAIVRQVSDRARVVLVVEAPAPVERGDHTDALFEEILEDGRAFLERATSRHPVQILLLVTYETLDPDFVGRVTQYAKAHATPLRRVDEFKYPSWDHIEDYLDHEYAGGKVKPTTRGQIKAAFDAHDPNFRAFLAALQDILDPQT